MNKNKIWWAIIFAVITVLSVWAITKQSQDFSKELFLSFIAQADKFWLVMAFVSTFGFIWFEGCAILCVARCLGYHRSVKKGTLYAAADVYFSAITPSASGGQPASAYFMMKDGMKASAIVIILLLNLIMYNMALGFLGIITMIVGRDIFLEFSFVPQLLVWLGFVVLILLIFLFYLLLCKAKILYMICNGIMHFFVKIHLLRNIEKKQKRLQRTIEEYQECAEIIINNKKMLFLVFWFNVLQRLSQLMVSFMIFMALGKGLHKSISVVLLQCFVALGSNSMPIPGAVGVADYIMLDGLRPLVGIADSVNVELLCRGITFYGSVGAGALISLVGYILQRKRRRKGELC